MIASADGLRGRWLVVIQRDRRKREIEEIDDLQELVRDRELEVLVIDVPIGLMDTGSRRCDVEAREMLGSRRNSVFPAPLRPMLKARSYKEACRTGRRIHGKACSQQTYAILPMIRAVDRIVTPRLQDRVFEGHPEVSFAGLAGEPMRRPKSDPRGFAARVAILAKHFKGLAEDVEDYPHSRGVIDLIDAHALLWTARRIRRGWEKRLPVKTQRDARRLRVEIVY